MDADFDLVFNKTLSQRNGSMGRGPGPAKVAKISKTCPHCDVTSRNPHRKRKIVFSMSTRKLAESVEGLNSSLALAAGDLWPKKCEPIHGLARSLEGPVQSSLNQSSSHGGRAGQADATDATALGPAPLGPRAMCLDSCSLYLIVSKQCSC